MSKSKNSVSLIGLVGRDAELRRTQADVPYARFTLATSEGGYRKSDGTDVPEVTQWHNITAWRQLAEMCGKYVRKGMKVAVDGKIIYGKYEKNGSSFLSVDIVADEVVLMSRPNDAPQGPLQAPQQPMAPPEEQRPTSTYNVPESGPNEDLPF